MDNQDATPWDSDIDGSASQEMQSSDLDSDQDSVSTETPAYKRGRHDQIMDEQALAAIRKEGMHYSVKKWLRKPRKDIVFIADSQVKDWPFNDRLCTLFYHQDRPIRHWASDLRMGFLDVQSATTIILYLEGLCNWEDPPPIKNCLQRLVSSLRLQQPECRVFVCNILPRVGGSPLQRSTNLEMFNFSLNQAIRSICRAEGKVFLLSVYEHFVSKRNKVLSPTYKYFAGDGQLTRLGCLTLRECIFREAGLKTYWFAGARDTKERKE